MKKLLYIPTFGGSNDYTVDDQHNFDSTPHKNKLNCSDNFPLSELQHTT